MSDSLMTTEDAAAFLQVDVGTLKNWRSQGKGPPFVRVESLVRYDPAELVAWLKRNHSEYDGEAGAG